MEEGRGRGRGGRREIGGEGRAGGNIGRGGGLREDCPGNNSQSPRLEGTNLSLRIMNNSACVFGQIQNVILFQVRRGLVGLSLLTIILTQWRNGSCHCTEPVLLFVKDSFLKEYLSCLNCHCYRYCFVYHHWYSHFGL